MDENCPLEWMKTSGIHQHGGELMNTTDLGFRVTGNAKTQTQRSNTQWDLDDAALK